MQNKDLTVIYFASDLFAEPCGVSIASLLDSNREFDTVSVYVMENGMTPGSRERLERIVESFGRTLHFIPMPDPQKYFGDSRFTVRTLGHTFGRMIVGDCLPKTVSRVLCLDSDMLVLDSLMELWNTDLQGCYVAGVDSAPGEAMMKKTLHMEAGSLYCNGGLFLMDLNAIRRDGMEEKYKAYISQAFDAGQCLGAYEEEVINRCCDGHMLRLHPRYNLMTVNLVMGYDDFVRFRGAVNYYSRQEMEEAAKNPAILHAINTFYVRKRYWEQGSDSPYADRYLYYREMTPWAKEAQIVANRSLKQKLMKEVWHWMPKKMAFFVAAFVRNEIRPRLAKKRDDE